MKLSIETNVTVQFTKGAKSYPEIFVMNGTDYSTKDVPKGAGFWWDGERRRWWTSDADKAARLVNYADDAARARLEGRAAQLDEARQASRAVSADIELPCPEGLAYLPYQRAGIAFASARPSTLIADEMGLGKTIQAIGVINCDDTVRRVLVVCPASLKLNWKRELEKWLTDAALRESIGIADGKNLPETSIIVINYDVLKNHADALAAMTFDVLIVDEAHLCKNPKAIRSKLVYALKARRRLFLTGTPIVNRPAELFPIINALDSQTWPNFFGFAKRYANAHQTRFGWDFSGAAHLDELQDKLRTTIMVRRLKKDVLTELPAKRRQVIELSANGASATIAREQKAYAAHQDSINALRVAVELSKASEDAHAYEDAVNALKEAARAAFTEMSKLRHQTALAKVPHVIEHVQNSIEDDGAKVILFAHHADVIAKFAEAFAGKCVVVTGETSAQMKLIEGRETNARQQAVDRFQNDPAIQVFIGNIQAAGVGLTLTASAHVIFAELDWVPGNVTQAEDRAHRIGQVQSVLIQHIVLEGSLDAQMAKTLVRKQAVIEAALDKEGVPAIEEPVVPETEKEMPATSGVSRERIAKEAETMPAAQITAIHQGLRMLAGVCDGATALDGAGFNKMDAAIGHSLAEWPQLTARQAALGKRLVNKYRRQLPSELLAAAKGE